MNWKLKSSNHDATHESKDDDNLDFSGGGKISVSVATIVNSEKVQRQVEGAKEIAASQPAANTAKK
jgi:hypothetical protein